MRRRGLRRMRKSQHSEESAEDTARGGPRAMLPSGQHGKKGGCVKAPTCPATMQFTFGFSSKGRAALDAVKQQESGGGFLGASGKDPETLGSWDSHECRSPRT
ncbi:hypothetical protein ColTof3_07814 [Colletotrichum tofieldiae]|nr:hypothetical protein ColTof3_07814 [Colletotrichum tofieldiae]